MKKLDRDPDKRFVTWKPDALPSCDWCRRPAKVLYIIPDGTPSGESDCVCRNCATKA